MLIRVPVIHGAPNRTSLFIAISSFILGLYTKAARGTNRRKRNKLITHGTDLDAAREDLADAVAQCLLQRTMKRPIVIPVIVSV